MAQRQLDLTDYIQIIRRRWLLIIAPAAVAGVLGYAVAGKLPKLYKSQTTVLVQQPTVPGDYVRPVVSQDVNQRLATMQQQILSRSRLEPIIQQFGLYRNETNPETTEALVERLRSTISISPVQAMAGTGGGLPGFTVSVTFGDPRVAQQICTAVTSMFMEKNLQMRTQQAEDTTQFLGKQLEDSKANLDDQDAKLAAFKRRYLGSLPDEEQTNLNLLMGLNTQLEAATQALSRAQQDKSFAESLLSQELAASQATESGQNPETFDQQLGALQSQLTNLQSKYTDDYPDVIKVKRDIAALKKKISELDEQKKSATPDKPAKTAGEPARIQQLRLQLYQYSQVIKERSAQQEEIQKQIQVYQARVQSSPAVEQEYKQLTRDYQTALEFYNELQKKRQQSAMATDLERRQEGEQFMILDPANLPDKPSFPNKFAFAFAGFGGGMALGAGLALFWELQDTSLHSEHDVELALHLPVLVMLPVINQESGKTRIQPKSLGSAVARTGLRI